MCMRATASGRKPWTRFAILCVVILAAQSGVASDVAHHLLGLVTGISSDDGPRLHFIAQKIFHVLVFGAVGLFVPLPSTRSGWFRVIVGCLVLAVGSEMLQMMSPGRSPRIFDTLLNIGACFTPLAWRARSRQVASGA